MDGIIEKVNKLQNLCTDIQNPINIPQIIVVGAQSSGKSSILENIIGHEILPRGTGMVTRRPLMIQIINTESAPYCTFGHLPGQVFKYTEVEAEIQSETERILDKKNDVSPIPIVLRIHKQDTLPITLVDLPGIIKVRSEGQPDGIVKKVEEIVRSYIQNTNTVVLAVTPANTDITSSDALMLAKEVDPDYERTLCVLTKVDLMDPGTDVLNVLQGRIINVKLGFIPVICRGELSLRENISISTTIIREKEYFKTHPVYTKNKKYCGIPYLITRLHELLKTSIVKSTPYLQDRISFLYDKAEKELLSVGLPVIDDKQMIMQVISEFTQDMDRKVSGTPKTKAKYISKEIVDGARVSYTLDVLFTKTINELDLFDATDTEIENVIHNTSGVFGGRSTSQSLYHFIEMAADKVQPHCVHASTKIFLEMQRMGESCLETEHLERFPKLKLEICKTITTLLKENLKQATASIKSFLHWNTVYIRPNTTSTSPTTVSASVSGDNEYLVNRTTEIEVLKHTVIEYLIGFKSTVVQQVPKIIIFEMVYKTMQTLQQRLIESIYVQEALSDLLKEESSTKERREQLQLTLIALEKAKEITNTL
ncbi:vacuolar protein sorting-associated protein 1 [Nematocida parisii]|nr:vacuolar protein sorting-associated protein 1 [Nematocida parisii]KAI5146375.1 vacuolar protein sorting-associated protein 1 [Nematocida parisii]KAI5159054.1 vacuolar protein sorting-associated protein 1 [Nematocida parisii]